VYRILKKTRIKENINTCITNTTNPAHCCIGLTKWMFKKSLVKHLAARKRNIPELKTARQMGCCLPEPIFFAVVIDFFQ
jgi:hypothetical protein